MEDNQDKKKEIAVPKNLHKFSVFPGILLLFQLFLLLFGAFKFSHEMATAFRQFLQESSLFLSIINGVLILWYWKKDAILKGESSSKESKIINSCICFINIVLLNEFYDNRKVQEAFISVKAFFAGKSIAAYVFVGILIIAAILLVRYMRKEDKNAPPEYAPLPTSPTGTTEADNSSIAGENGAATADAVQPQQPPTPPSGQAPQQGGGRSEKALFFIILILLFAAIAAVVYFLVAKYDILANMLKTADVALREKRETFANKLRKRKGV